MNPMCYFSSVRAVISVCSGVLLIGLILSCRKDPSLWKIENLSGNRVTVFGHGGMGYRCSLPMNSMESLCQCLEMGADGTEMDLQMSADSVLFLYHDNDLGDATTANGKISEHTSVALASCKYKKDGKKHALIPASAFFEGCGKKQDVIFTLECKIGSSDQGIFARALMRLIDKYDLEGKCLIESVEPSFLKLLETANPSLQTYLYAKDPQVALNLRNSLAFDGLTISMDLISAAHVKQLHDRGLKVSLFSMATPKQNIDALEMGPDNVQTDKLEHLVEVYVKRR